MKDYLHKCLKKWHKYLYKYIIMPLGLYKSKKHADSFGSARFFDSPTKNKCLAYATGFFAIFLIIGAFVFLFPELAAAQETKKLAGEITGKTTSLASYLVSLLSTLVYYLVIYPINWFIILAFQILVAVASYNDFLTAQAVIKGWVVVRDIANMSIIVFLLIIAFAIMLRLETYGNRKMLVKLLIMAFLINFSKTITGFLIDISQIVMLTFVNGFKIITGVSLVQSLGIAKFMSFGSADRSQTTEMFQVLAGIVLASLFMFAILAVVVVIIMTLVWRIVNLWMLVILSPLAFIASAVPFLKSFYSQWMKKFTNFLINGPLLAFFLWLSLNIMNGLSRAVSTGTDEAVKSGGAKTLLSELGAETGSALTEAFTAQNTVLIMMSIGLLVGSLTLAAEFGAVGAKTAEGLITKTAPKLMGKGLQKFDQYAVGGIGRALTGRQISLTAAAGRLTDVGKTAYAKGREVWNATGMRARETGGLLGVAATGVRKLAGREWGEGARATGWTVVSRAQSAEERRRSLKNDMNREQELQDYEQSGVKSFGMGQLLELQKERDQFDVRSLKDNVDQYGLSDARGSYAAGELKKHDKIESKISDLRSTLGITEDVDQEMIDKEIENRDSTKKKLEQRKNKGEISKEEFETMEERFEPGIERIRLKKRLDAGEINDNEYKNEISKLPQPTMDDNLIKETLSGDNIDLKNAKQKFETQDEFTQGLKAAAGRVHASYDYRNSKRAEEAAVQRGMELAKEKIGENLDDEDEMAEALKGALSKRVRDINEVRFILKTAGEQGLLKDVIESAGYKADASGLREILNTGRGVRRPADSTKMDKREKHFLEQLSSLAKKEGAIELSNLVKTDPSTGKSEWADTIKTETGNKQQDSTVKMIKKNQIPPNKLSKAMVEDGKLTGTGERAFMEAAGNMEAYIRRGNLPTLVIEALMDGGVADGLRKEIQEKIDKGVKGYSDSNLFEFDKMMNLVKERKGIVQEPRTAAELQVANNAHSSNKADLNNLLSSVDSTSPDKHIQIVVNALNQHVKEMQKLNKSLGRDKNTGIDEVVGAIRTALPKAITDAINKAKA